MCLAAHRNAKGCQEISWVYPHGIIAVEHGEGEGHHVRGEVLTWRALQLEAGELHGSESGGGARHLVGAPDPHDAECLFLVFRLQPVGTRGATRVRGGMQCGMHVVTRGM